MTTIDFPPGAKSASFPIYSTFATCASHYEFHWPTTFHGRRRPG